MEEAPQDRIPPVGRVEQRREFVLLRAKGLSLAKIAKSLRVSKTTLAAWGQELDGEIASQRAVELEALQEEYFLLKEGRIRLLGDLQAKLREEAMARDFSEIPTDRLLALLLQYQEALQKEYVEPRVPLGATLRDRTGTKLDSQAIGRELEGLLERYRGGLLDDQRARQELALLVALLKAEEQGELARKLEAIETALEERR